MKTNHFESKLSLPAGRYFFGDPAQILQDDTPKVSKLWKQICENTTSNKIKDQVGCIGGVAMILCNVYGDDTYYDSEGWEYTVDSGLLGLISLSDLERKKISVPEKGLWHGKVIDTKDPISMEIKNNYIFINDKKEIDIENLAER